MNEKFPLCIIPSIQYKVKKNVYMPKEIRHSQGANKSLDTNINMIQISQLTEKRCIAANIKMIND